MNDFSKLSQEEKVIVCELISGKTLKKHYQKYPKGFAAIKPGFRVAALSEQDAISLAVKKADHPFVSHFVNDCIALLMDGMEKSIQEKQKTGLGYEQALIFALQNGIFAEHAELYFNLLGDSFKGNYSAVIATMLEILPNHDMNSKEEGANEELERIKADYEKSIGEYQAQIQTLTAQTDEANQQLVKKASVITQMTDELRMLRANAKWIHDSKIEKNEEYPFLSVYLVREDWEGKQRLFRLADINNDGELTTDFFNTPSYYKLFSKDIPIENGQIGVWKWKVGPDPENSMREFVDSRYCYGIRHTEVHFVQDVDCVDQILKILQSGLNYMPSSKQILFAFAEGDEKICGILCKAWQLCKKNDMILLKDNVFSLPYFEFPQDVIIRIDSFTFYRFINLGIPKCVLHVKPIDDIVKSIFLKRITRNTMAQSGFNKGEFQRYYDFISSLITQELVDEVASECQCDVETAQSYIDAFIERSDEYLKSEDIENKVLYQSICNNEPLRKLCMQLVEREWLQQNEFRIEEANKQHEGIVSQVQQQTQHLSELRNEHHSLVNQIDDFKQFLSGREQLAADVEEKIQARIEAAKRDASDFISQFAFLPNCESKTIPTEDIGFQYITGVDLDSEKRHKSTTWEQEVMYLAQDLKKAGIDEKYAKQFAAFVYSAMVQNKLLLLAGPNGADIADALSAVICGKTASRLCIQNGQIPEICYDEVSEIICLEKPFEIGFEKWTHLNKCKNKYFILVHPTPEDLMIEPKTVFSYALPVLTEPLIGSDASCSYRGAFRSQEFAAFSFTKDREQEELVASELRMGRVAKKHINEVAETMHYILRNSANFPDIMFAYVPYAVATGQVSSLLDEIDENGLGLSKNEKEDIISCLEDYQ